MDAYVTVRFLCTNLCNQEDLDNGNKTFEEMVRWLVQEESIIGISDSEEVIKIEQVPE